MNPQLTCSQCQWLHSSVDRASHRYREVMGSNPIEVLNFFQASSCNCINCVHCGDHFFIFKTEHVTPLFIECSLVASWTAYPVFFITFQAPQGLHWTMLIMNLLKKINHWDLCFCSQNLLAKQAFNLKTNGGRSLILQLRLQPFGTPCQTIQRTALQWTIIVQMQALKSLNLFSQAHDKKNLKNYLTDSRSVA